MQTRFRYPGRNVYRVMVSFRQSRGAKVSVLMQQVDGGLIFFADCYIF